LDVATIAIRSIEDRTGDDRFEIIAIETVDDIAHVGGVTVVGLTYRVSYRKTGSHGAVN
jgi:hypothetical protein